jgi:hypothetical protein
MSKKEKINEKQVAFFKLIQESSPASHSFVDVISDLLGCSNDSAYRRMRGVTPLVFDEITLLCRQFEVSFDSIIGVAEKTHIQCLYTPLDVNKENNLLTYLNAMLATIKSIRSKPGSEIIVSASDIPVFSLSMFTELVYFKFYSWSKSVYRKTEKYDDFMKNLDKEKIMKCYNEIVSNYEHIPSTEIWSASTVDTFLSLLKYHYFTESFKDNTYPIHLCEQLLKLIDILQKWTESGKKFRSGTPFKLFISDSNIENTFALFKERDSAKCIIKLFTINYLFISDEAFCVEMENWLRDVARQATLISDGSATYRHNFFAGQRLKINDCKLLFSKQ